MKPIPHIPQEELYEIGRTGLRLEGITAPQWEAWFKRARVRQLPDGPSLVISLADFPWRNLRPEAAGGLPIYHGRRWPVGLSNASKRLGVSIGHLHHVLTGKRTSPRVVSEYQALCDELAGKEAA